MEEKEARKAKNEAKKAMAAEELNALVNEHGQEEALASLTCNELRGFCGRLFLGASRGPREDMTDALIRFLNSDHTANRSPKSRARPKAPSKAGVCSKRKVADSVQVPVRRIRQKQCEPDNPEPAQDEALATGDLNEMTVRALRTKCRELLLSQHGKKEDLVERIVQAARVRTTIGVASAGAASALTAAVAAATAAHGVDAWPQAFEKQVRALNSACAEWGGDVPARSALEHSIGRLEELRGGLSGKKNIVIRDGS